MVDLPSTPNVVPQIHAPQSRVSASDIEQPYQEMAANLDKSAGVLNTAAVAIAKNAGLKAVTRDADGNVQIENPPLIGDAAIAFHQAVKVAAVADGEGVAKRDDIALREQHRDDPNGYVAAADAYKKEKIQQYTDAAGPDVGITLGKIIDGQTTLTYRGLLNEHERLTMQRADASIQAGITSATDDLTAMARGGVTAGPAWDAAQAKVQALTQQRVNNPRLAYPPEQAAYDMQHLEGELKANAYLNHIDQVYKSPDPEKGGSRGALEEAKSILSDGSLKLTEQQREGYYHKAVGEIRANEAIRHQDISEARGAASELRLQFAAGAGVSSDDVEHVAKGFEAAGDPGGAAALRASFIRKPLVDDHGNQPLAVQTQQLTALQGMNAIRGDVKTLIAKGYSPQAAAAIGSHLVHESGGDPTAMGDGGTSGGLAQFHDERLTALKAFATAAGKPWTDHATQLDFIDRELHTTESGTLAKLKAAKTPEEAAAAFYDYERPAGWKSGDATGARDYASRLGLARQIFDGSPGDMSMGPAGSAWLIAHRQYAVNDAATSSWKTVMADYNKEGTRPSVQTVIDVQNAARVTGNGALLDTIAADAQRMNISGEHSQDSLPTQHATIGGMAAAGQRGDLPPAMAALQKDLQRRTDAITSGLKDDPIATAATNMPYQIKPQLPVDWSSDQAAISNLQARGKIAQIAANKWQPGGPLSALDSADVAQVQGMLASPDPAVKGRVFNALSALPEDVRNATLAKIGSGRPDLMVSVAAGSMMKAAPDVASSIIRGQQAIAIDKGYTPEKGAEATAFDQKFGEQLPASTFSLAARTDASGPYAVAQGMVKARYADLSAQSADTTGKLNPDRLTQAVNDVTGGILDHNGGKLIAPVRGMPQSAFDKTMYGITDNDLAGVSTMSGQPVTANYLRNNATLESVGDGRYFVKLGKDPLKPVYAYQGANTEAPAKFMLDLRNRPQGTVPLPTQVAMP